MTAAAVLWRRLDVPGHDACRLEESGDGWVLEGTAVFAEGGAPARLAYRVTCDRAWRTRECRVRGWIGSRPVELAVEQPAAGEWTVNGVAVAGLERCSDFDLGFTPATNLFQLRRLGLALGEAADLPVAWFDPAADGLEVLFQRYERRGELTYWYEAPKHGYAALLELDAAGFIRRYPGLWEAVPTVRDG